MHEQSLVKALLKQVDEIRRQQGADFVSEVRIEMGPLSGVEPLLLASAFEGQIGDDARTACARLVIDEVSLVAECLSCEQAFHVQEFVFRCPKCGSNVRVTRGDECQLVSVSVSSGTSGQEAAG